VSKGQENKAVIRTPDQRLRVFVSSALGELAEERRAVSQAISALRLTPVMFEQGARAHPPRDVYRAYLAQKRGVHRAVLAAVRTGAPRRRCLRPGGGVRPVGEAAELLYVKEPAPGRDPRLARLLDRIRQEGAVSYRTFSGSAELGRLVRDDLAALLSERFAATGVSTRAWPGSPRGPRPLPVSTTTLFGREQEIGEVASLLARPGVRLVTLTGPGGVGKTRLAVAVAERLRESFGASTVFVSLAAVTGPRAGAVRDRPGGRRRPGGDTIGDAGRMARRRAVAAHPGQPGAGGRRRR